MTEKQTLDRLWDAHSETPFASFTLERKLNLNKNEYRDTLNLLSACASSGETTFGYRVHKPASTVYKMTQAQQNDSDTAKGKPLIDENEAVLGQSEGGFPSNDGQNEPLERFSFFTRANNSKEATSAGTVEKFINHVRTNAGWKHRIETVRAIDDEALRKEKKAGLPGVTASVEITKTDSKRESLRDGEFVHTNLIQGG